MQAARPEGRSVLASRFDRIFTVRRCPRLNLKNPLSKEGAGICCREEQTELESHLLFSPIHRIGILLPLKLCNFLNGFELVKND